MNNMWTDQVPVTLDTVSGEKTNNVFENASFRVLLQNEETVVFYHFGPVCGELITKYLAAITTKQLI